MKTLHFLPARKGAAGLWLGALLLCSTVARAEPIPVSGKPVPGLDVFDTLMTELMETNDVSAGLLGVMKDGRIIYQHGFGWKDEGRSIPLQETAMMRLASVTKPLTAAAIRQLEQEGLLDVHVDRAFELGQTAQFPTNKILDCLSSPELGGYPPFPDPNDPGDPRLGDITVYHLLVHQGGWDRDRVPKEYTNDEWGIADDMETNMPPGRANTMRWILGKELQYDPGTATNRCAYMNDLCAFTGGCTHCDSYSNVGYLTLGLIVEQLAGEDYLSYVKRAVFGPLPWCPTSFLQQGHTLFEDAHPLEPWYDNVSQTDTNVYPPHAVVPSTYGAWDHEARLMNGGLISDTRTILKYLDSYNVGLRDPDIGKELGGIRVTESHGGDKLGTMALAYQRQDGFNFVAIFNRHQPDAGTNLSMRATLMQGLAAAATDPSMNWPETGVDGQWVRFESSATGESGSFDQPYTDLTTALQNAPSEETLNITGESDWTGTIDQVVRLRAHYGTAVIGQP